MTKKSKRLISIITACVVLVLALSGCAAGNVIHTDADHDGICDAHDSSCKTHVGYMHADGGWDSDGNGRCDLCHTPMHEQSVHVDHNLDLVCDSCNEQLSEGYVNCFDSDYDRYCDGCGIRYDDKCGDTEAFKYAVYTMVEWLVDMLNNSPNQNAAECSDHDKDGWCDYSPTHLVHGGNIHWDDDANGYCDFCWIPLHERQAHIDLDYDSACDCCGEALPEDFIHCWNSRGYSGPRGCDSCDGTVLMPYHEGCEMIDENGEHYCMHCRYFNSDKSD